MMCRFSFIIGKSGENIVQQWYNTHCLNKLSYYQKAGQNKSGMSKGISYDRNPKFNT